MLAYIGDFREPFPDGGASIVDHYIADQLEEMGVRLERFPAYGVHTDWSDLFLGKYTSYFVSIINSVNFEAVMRLSETLRPYTLLRHDIPGFVYNPGGVAAPVRLKLEMLFGASFKIIYISPLQKEIFERFYAGRNSLVIPPPVMFEGFEPSCTLGSDSLSFYREADPHSAIAAVDYFRKNIGEGRLNMYGVRDSNGVPSDLIATDIVLHPPVARREVPEVFRGHRNLLHIPNYIDSFCLKVLEAELCGVAVHTIRERIGRYSFALSAENLRDYMQQRSLGRIYDVLVHADLSIREG